MNPTGHADPWTLRQSLQAYYRLHARIYDATRWSFLFGRGRLVRILADQPPSPGRILEVGCGTGANLTALRRALPTAQLTGVDLCGPMLAKARYKAPGCILEERAYDEPVSPDRPFDAVVFSYALSMFNPGYQAALDSALADLRPGGRVGVVDFHATGSDLFRGWMARNHVRMDGHLLPALQARFALERVEVRPAYLGLWDYLLFVGFKA